jgi:hypothetical protein
VFLKDAPGYHRLIFYVDLGEQTLEAETLSDLAGKARNFKDERFSLPFVTRDGRKGTVTGFHAANGNLLIRWATGKSYQARTYEFTKPMPELSDEDYQTLMKLLEAEREAQKALESFLDEHAFANGLKGAAEEARRKVAGIE